MPSDQNSYFRARRDAERDLARASTNPVVAAIHQDLAELYDKLIAQDDVSQADTARYDPPEARSA